MDVNECMCLILDSVMDTGVRDLLCVATFCVDITRLNEAKIKVLNNILWFMCVHSDKNYLDSTYLCELFTLKFVLYF